MTNDEIIKMLEVEWRDRLKAAVLDEREACARVCEALGNDADIEDMVCSAFQQADEAIRARGKEMQP